MRIVLVGVSCVGKTTVGAILAEQLGYRFVDFDAEVISRMGASLTTIKQQCGDEAGYRRTVKPILRRILKEYQDDLVLAMPPGGMFPEYTQGYDRHPDVVTVWMTDKAKNILRRSIFTDDDDQLVSEAVVTEENARWYLEEVREDKHYFRDTLRKAHVKFDVAGRDAQEAATALARMLFMRMV